MKSTILICFCSALVGGMMGAYATGSFTFEVPVLAQQSTLAESTNPGAFLSDQQPIPKVVPPVVFNDPEFLSLEEKINISVYKNVNRSVVNISTIATRVDFFMFQQESQAGSGSGWVFDDEGHVVTNYHVIAGSDAIEVTLYDGSSHTAKVIGVDRQNDIAVLRIQADRSVLSPVELGNSAQLLVGQKVFAISNPFGLERTMTVGIVSSLNRTLQSKNNRRMKNIIQLDAALNQGNSGGPLLNSRSQLVGMNTAIASLTGENTGVGFAVPSNTIQRVVPQLIEFGRVQRASLGIDMFWKTSEGLRIARVVQGGAAEKAGLLGFTVERGTRQIGNQLVQFERLNRKTADRVIAVAGREIKSVDDLHTAIDGLKPGARVNVTIDRNGRRLDVPVVLGLEY